MKRLTSMVLAGLIGCTALFGCSANKSAENIPEPDSGQVVNVAVGHDLKKLGLDVFYDQVETKALSYRDVAINGSCTEISADAGTESVSIMMLQGFYKSDLSSRSVMVENKLLLPSDLTNKIVYDDGEVVVYDLSTFIYSDTLDDRVSILESDQPHAMECADQIQTLIAKRTQLVPKQDNNDPPAVQVKL